MSEIQIFIWCVFVAVAAFIGFLFGVYYETDKRNERLIKGVFNVEKTTTKQQDDQQTGVNGRANNKCATAYDELDQWGENGYH